MSKHTSHSESKPEEVDGHDEDILPKFKTYSHVNGVHMKGSPNEQAHRINVKSTENQSRANESLVGGSGNGNTGLHGTPVGECNGVSHDPEIYPPSSLTPKISPETNTQTGTKHAAETAVNAHATRNCTGPAPSPDEIKQDGGSKTKKKINKKTKKGKNTKKGIKTKKNNNSKKNINSKKNNKIKGILKKKKKTKISNKNKKSKKTKKVRFYK